MLVKEYDRVTGRVRKTKSRYGLFTCDVCEREYERAMKCRRSERDSCSRVCMNKGRVHTHEWKTATSERMRGEGNHFFDQKHDDVVCEKISQSVIGAWRRPEYRKAQLERLSAQTGEKNPFFGRRHDEQTRRRMSETRSHKIANGDIRGGPRGRQGLYTSTITQRVEHYDSFYELLRMRMLDINSAVESWTKQHGIQIPYELDGHHRMYVPDFYVLLGTGHVRLEEVKGYEDEVKRNAKLQALLNYCEEHEYGMMYLDAQLLEQYAQHVFGASITTLRKREFQT